MAGRFRLSDAANSEALFRGLILGGKLLEAHTTKPTLSVMNS